MLTKEQEQRLLTLKDEMQRLWCQHCKALQKTNETTVECWYNPFDHGSERAFCAANCDAINYFVFFLASQGLGLAEELLEFPDMVFYCKDCDKMVTNTRCNTIGAGAVKFVPLEIKWR